MCTPRKFVFRANVDWLSDVAANPLCTRVSIVDSECIVSHIPIAIITEGDKRIAIGHVARDNPHWHHWSPDAPTTKLIFTDLNAYVSPGSYQDAIQVPTWNYVAVHLNGHPTYVEHDHEPWLLHGIMDALIATFEPDYLSVWQALSQNAQEKLLCGILGFRMPIDSVECIEKMSQNRTHRDAIAIAAVLDAKGSSDVAQKVLEVRQ